MLKYLPADQDKTKNKCFLTSSCLSHDVVFEKMHENY